MNRRQVRSGEAKPITASGLLISVVEIPPPPSTTGENPDGKNPDQKISA
jgi:hypothetical protein